MTGIVFGEVDPQGRTADLTETEQYRLLTEEQRRLALEVLADRDGGPIELADLAAAIAERERGAADEAAVERVAVTLHHNHLPRMDALGVLDYDPASRLVRF